MSSASQTQGEELGVEVEVMTPILLRSCWPAKLWASGQPGSLAMSSGPMPPFVGLVLPWITQ